MEKGNLVLKSLIVISEASPRSKNFCCFTRVFHRSRGFQPDDPRKTASSIRSLHPRTTLQSANAQQRDELTILNSLEVNASRRLLRRQR
jgi:hypothetical protein